MACEGGRRDRNRIRCSVRGLSGMSHFQRIARLLALLFGPAAVQRSGDRHVSRSGPLFRRGRPQHRARAAVASLATHLEHDGPRYVATWLDVHIELLDLDRAGSPRMNLPTELRVMDGGANFPCALLAFTATSAIGTVESGRERVCDVNYLRSADLRDSPNAPMVYDKRMLDDWSRALFGPRAVAAHASTQN